MSRTGGTMKALSNKLDGTIADNGRDLVKYPMQKG